MKKYLPVFLTLMLLQTACGSSHKEQTAPVAPAAAAVSGVSIDAFSSAVLSNDVAVVRDAIKGGIDLNQKDSGGHYALEQVLPMGNCEMAQTLLDAGADDSVRTAEGKTIYELAMATDNSTLIKIFSSHKK